jgi:hypothetical protein
LCGPAFFVCVAAPDDVLELALLEALVATEDTDEEALETEDETEDKALVDVVMTPVAEEDDIAVVAVEAIVEEQDTAFEF